MAAMRRALAGLGCLACAFALPVGSSAAPAQVMLAAAGQARAAIVLAADAIPAEKTAAAELAAYLRACSGAEFGVAESAPSAGQARLLVGPSPAARAVLGDACVDGLGPEEFIVRTVGPDLLLVGGRPRGTLYAVYSFLEQDLGCRWTTWYDDESIPRQAELSVPALDRREAPALAVRDIVTHPNQDTDRQALQRFLVRNRCQGPDLRFTGDLTAVGGTSHRFAYPPDGWLVHTLFQWLPPATHFAAHPEWYSLAGEQRVSTRQLCFSNPGLRAALTTVILDRIGAADPGGLYSVSAMDWTGAFCDCAGCRALVEREGTPGAPLFDYLAELGPLVKQRYPEASISTLAYRKEQSEAPPRALRLPDNIVVIFAPIDDNFAAPLEDASNAGTRRHLEDWRRATAHLWVWYYPNPYGPALPVGNLHKLAQDIRLCQRLGVEGFYVEHDGPGVYDSRRLADLQTWLITKLLWNADRDLDGLITDYTEHHYGAAAAALRQYIAGLEAATAAGRVRLSWNAGAGQHRFLTPEFLLASQRCLDAAQNAVAGEPGILLRVKQARLSLDLACILLWDRLANTAELPFTKTQVIERYRATYTETVTARNLPTRRDLLLGALQDSLKWYALLTPLAPLPAALAGVPAERVRQLTPETARLHGKNPTLVTDPSAAAGIAATMVPSLTKPPYAPADLPAVVLNLGFYDALTGRQQHAYAGKESPLTPGPYRLVPIGRTALSPDCCIWFDWSWCIQFQDVAGLYDPAAPAKEWDIYASLRVEGPAFDPQGPWPENRVYVDRLVLVEAEH